MLFPDVFLEHLVFHESYGSDLSVICIKNIICPMNMDAPTKALKRAITSWVPVVSKNHI